LKRARFDVDTKLSIYFTEISSFGGSIFNEDTVDLNFNYRAELWNVDENKLLDSFSGSKTLAPGGVTTITKRGPNIGKKNVMVMCLFEATGSAPNRDKRSLSDTATDTTF